MKTTNKIGHFPDHLDRIEARICNRLITTILSNDHLIRVRCGEGGDVLVKATNNRAMIQFHTAQTDMTCYDIVSCDPATKALALVGTVMLIHGNDVDVISDFSWPSTKPENEKRMDTLVRRATKLADTL